MKTTMPRLLKHRYRIMQVLSEAGGFGQTLLAEVTDVPSRRRCVIKKLRPIADPDAFKLAQERFQREAAVLERLGEESDHVPKLYAYFVEEQEFYLVQEFVEGPTLRQMVRQTGPLSEQAVGELLIDLLSVLAYIHERNVIHRDVKPDNVIVRQRDHKPVLIDFGIVKEVLREGGDGLPARSAIMGTPGYIPQEQAAGQAVFASDLYSLGATVIFLLTGKNPRWMTDPATGRLQWRQHAPAVGPVFAAVLDRATEPDVRVRYRTAGQMRDDLRSSLNSVPRVVTPRPSAEFEEETIVRPTALNPTLTEGRRPDYTLHRGLAATVLCLLAVICSAAVLTRLDAPHAAENTAAEATPPSSKQLSPGEKPRPIPSNKPANPSVREKATQVSGRFPEASMRLLTDGDLDRKSPLELRVMRNEIYARHGYIFTTPEMRRYFARQQWYRPRYDDVSKLLSELEIQNAQKIKSAGSRKL